MVMSPYPYHYADRVAHCTNPALITLYKLMAEKKTNLAVAADVTDKHTLIQLAEAVGPEICLLKTHIDTMIDFDMDLIDQLVRLADQHHFLLFEDRKFADIGKTVQNQYAKGLYRIVDWADFVTVHAVGGPGSIEALKQVGLAKGHGAFLLVQMSSSGHLMNSDYQAAALRWAKQYRDFVAGIITQRRLIKDPACLHLTPGVHRVKQGDALGQQYQTPEQAILAKGNDIIIVGRGIYQAENPRAEAVKYRQAGWQAYEQMISL